jgi:uncharacterized protein YkwD
MPNLSPRLDRLSPFLRVAIPLTAVIAALVALIMIAGRTDKTAGSETTNARAAPDDAASQPPESPMRTPVPLATATATTVPDGSEVVDALSGIAPAPESTPLEPSASPTEAPPPLTFQGPSPTATLVPQPAAPLVTPPPPPPAPSPIATATIPPPAPTLAPPTPIPPPPPAPTPVPQPPPVSLNAIESALLAAHNEERNARGLGSLSANGILTAIARERAQDMAANNYFAHTSPSGETAFTLMDEANVSYSLAAENIANGTYGPDQIVDVTMDAFMNSSGHRQNILEPSFTKIGIGVAQVGGRYYIAVVFTAP